MFVKWVDTTNYDFLRASFATLPTEKPVSPEGFHSFETAVLTSQGFSKHLHLGGGVNITLKTLW